MKQLARFLKGSASTVLFRALIGCACALILTVGGVVDAGAQPASKPAPSFRILALGWDVQGLFYDDTKANPVPIEAGTAGFSVAYPVPPGGRVVFYRLLPLEPGELKPRRVAVTEARITGEGPHLVFLAATTETGESVSAQAVEDSWETHPGETIRIFSFSSRPIVVKIGSAVADLNPGQSKVLPYTAGGQFWMQAATKDPAGWAVRISSPQVAPPTVRISAVFFDQRPSEDRKDTHELQFFKLMDLPPPPATP